MSTTHRVLTASAVGALVVLATTGVPPGFRAAAAALVTGAVAAGQQWRMPTVVASGLLGLVVVVGAGPAGAAGPLGLLAWAIPTWAVVLVSSRSLRPDARPARDTRTRRRLAGGEVAAAVASLPLAVVAATASRVAVLWSAAGGAALVGVLLLVTSRRTPQADGPGPPS